MLRSLTILFAATVLALTSATHAAPTAKAAPAPEAAKAQTFNNLHHPVFAHYMVCFGNTVEFYKHEIELAQRHGIDGFALNCGSWSKGYQTSSKNLYEAAKQLDSGFKLFFSVDAIGIHKPGPVEDMIKTYEHHPNQFKWNGETVLSSYGGSGSIFVQWVKKIEADGHPVFLVPFIWNPRLAITWSYDTALNYFRNAPDLDGIFNFAASPIWSTVTSNANGKRAAMHFNKIYMAGVIPSYNSANVRDFHGMEGYGDVWQSLIRDDADWVEIVTWSDYNEDSNLMPFRWPAGAQKAYYTKDESFLDVTDYYSKWYKSGVQPTIVQDKVFLAYRDRTRHQTKAWNPATKAYDPKTRKNVDVQPHWVDITGDQWPRDQFHDDNDDGVYATAFLTAPAKLTVTIGDHPAKTVELPAGVHTIQVDKLPGVPAVKLERGGKVLLQFSGRRQIIDKITKENSPFGYHLLNRLWMQGDVAGQPVAVLDAASGQLANGAKIVTIDHIKAVENLEQDGSGFTVPVHGLKTSTYAIRITYCNPSPDNARLTLFADGVDLGKKRFPYFIPAFLPPTGKDQFKTVSFFWSLYDATTHLNLQWQKDQGMFGRVQPNAPWGDDRGQVAVAKIALVKVEQSPMPKPRQWRVPEMVQIPGGSFAMGSKAGEPDEAPVHKVTLSPFLLSKYEITNRQYELYKPGHRKFRDSFSWRDREPVIYLNWKEAAGYCNWLSKQVGLTPVYNEKYEIDRSADGFRLPTEAQWEYEATGRGEGRMFPWGNEAVDATRANVLPPSAYAPTGHPRSTGSNAGVMVVGSYPLGASRDGIMDMAGNVSEWCQDTFAPYTDKAAKDPLDDHAGAAYRAIRGGSWGFYNKSQRNTDREFNNPGYPGLIYVGFRVAAPASSWKKIQQQRLGEGG